MTEIAPGMYAFTEGRPTDPLREPVRCGATGKWRLWVAFCPTRAGPGATLRYVQRRAALGQFESINLGNSMTEMGRLSGHWHLHPSNVGQDRIARHQCSTSRS
jgi:hypothetical protein